MKVYAVLCNNEEIWPEDYREWIDSIHETRDGAERRIEELNKLYGEQTDSDWNCNTDYIVEYELME